MFIFLLIVAIWVAIFVFAAKEFQQIATMKGHPENKYFWCCFWLGAIGWLMVVALPDRGNAAEKTVKANTDELPDL